MPPVTVAAAVVIVENVPAADVVAPIIVSSTAPPFRSTESDTNVENVPADDVVAPIVVPSIVPPVTAIPLVVNESI